MIVWCCGSQVRARRAAWARQVRLRERDICFHARPRSTDTFVVQGDRKHRFNLLVEKQSQLRISNQASQEIIVASETSSSPSKDAVLSKAALNAAKQLGLSHTELAKLLGTSEVSAYQLAASERFLDPSGHEGERALMLVQIFRALAALVGGEPQARVTWMNKQSKAIADSPKHAVQTLSGLRRTQAYLNSLVTAASDGQVSIRNKSTTISHDESPVIFEASHPVFYRCTSISAAYLFCRQDPSGEASPAIPAWS